MKVLLKPIDESQLQRIAEYRNRPEIKKTLRSYMDTYPSNQDAWLESVVKDNTRSYYLIYFPNNDKKLLGYCGLDKMHFANRTAEISLLIDPGFHGRGIGSATVQSILDIAFNQFNLNLVYADTYTTTYAYKFWERCGFVQEAKLRMRKYYAQKYYESVILSITNEEYRK